MRNKQQRLISQLKGDPTIEEIVRAFRQGRSTSSRSIACISDMHVGSSMAICTEEPYIEQSGGYFKPMHRFHGPFLEKWNSMPDLFWQKPHILSLNGEPFNGVNRKSNGAENWSSDMNDQMEDARKLIKRLPYTMFVMTRGSNYHVNRDGSSDEENFARSLNSVVYSAYLDKLAYQRYEFSNSSYTREIGPFTDYMMWFVVNERLISQTHHLGFNRYFAYRTTALAREMASVVFQKGRYYPEDMDVSVYNRGHVHYHVGINFGNSIGYSTPAWKFADGHLFRNGLAGTDASIGCIELIIEQNGYMLVNKHLMTNSEYPKPLILDLTDDRPKVYKRPAQKAITIETRHRKK